MTRASIRLLVLLLLLSGCSGSAASSDAAVGSSDAAPSDAASEDGASRDAAPSSCVDGVDCFCDVRAELLGCHDFASEDLDGVEPIVGEYVSWSPTAAGFRSPESGDLGALRMTLTGQSPGQNAYAIYPRTSGIGVQSGVLSVGFLIKAGPSFWSRFSHPDGKFILVSGTGNEDTNWVPMWRSVGSGACATPYMVPMVPSELGQAPPTVDEFGNNSPGSSACAHTIRLSDELAGEWVWIEATFDAQSGLGQLYLKRAAGGESVMYSATSAALERSGAVALFLFQVDPTPTAPDADSYADVDLILIDDAFIGAPF